MSPREVSGRRLSRRAVLRGAVVVAAGALGAACQGSRAPTPAPAAPAAPAATAATTAAGATPRAAVALGRPEKIKVAWTAVTGAQSGVYVAHDMGTWRDLNLDVELVRMGSSSQMAAALRAGELDGGVLDWTLAFQFQAQGGNAREVSAITNRQPFSVMAQPSITQPQDVVGKRWGITRLGSAVHTASLVALDQWGLRGDDVQFLALQEVPAILAALQAGQIDVGVVSPPTNIRAVQAGFRELLDLAEDGPEYPSVGLAIIDRHITENPALVRAYVAGYAAGVARFRKDRDGSIEVLRKYLQLDDQSVLDETYARFTRYLGLPPVLPPAASLERVKEDAIKSDPSVANVAVTDVAEPRFVQELIDDGYFETL
ncbi:MAG TPA: ABC transporter substrate-binding protein [Chloroflexota bacterium]|nr:ABC transporter substrate-binding protein [Chloroflexota bacterium]